MSWIRENTLSFAQMLVVKILKSGEIPKHVALIMDGNRRYANKMKVACIQGHSAGFDRLTHVLHWCMLLEIPEVTIYAFSIENFKRQKDAVDGLINMATEKFQKLLDEEDKLMEHGVRINIIGNTTLIPENLLKAMAKAVIITRNNNKFILNIAFAYTSRDEITQTIKTITEGASSSEINPGDIDEDIFSKCSYTYQSRNPDLVIRTSGEVRFSDFLLWQITHSYIYFTSVLWPEFSIWDFLTAIFYYQRNYLNLNKAKCKKNCNQALDSTRASIYTNRLHQQRKSRWNIQQFDKLENRKVFSKHEITM